MGPLKSELSLKKDINLMSDWSEWKTETKGDRQEQKSGVITGQSESSILFNPRLAEAESAAHFSVILVKMIKDQWTLL